MASKTPQKTNPRTASGTSRATDETSIRSYADRLILEQLVEMESAVKLSELSDRLGSHGFGLGAIRNLLASNPERFAFSDRRWIPAVRLNAVGRPVKTALTMVIDSFGGVAAKRLVVTEVARVRETSEETVTPLVDRILTTDPDFLILSDGRVALSSLGFLTGDQTFERALALNGVDIRDVDALREKLGDDFDYTATDAVAKAITKAGPVSLRVLGAAFHQALNSDDPRSILVYNGRDVLRQALEADGAYLDGSGTLANADVAKSWVQSAIKLSDRLKPVTEVDDAQPLEIRPEDMDGLVQKILASSGATVTASRLLEDNYEITAGSKSHADDLKTLTDTLSKDQRVRFVGGDRFRDPASLPEGLNELPEPFQFVATDLTHDDGDPVDFELTDEGLSTSLRKLLTHPLAMDVADEDVQPAPKTVPEQIRLVLKSIHRELGTFPLAQIPTGFLDAEPELQELLVQDGDGRELSIWSSMKTRLTTGWIEWWLDQPVESGAVFTLTKTSKPNVFEFAWLDQPDPVVYISPERMEELRRMGADADGKSTFELVREVMTHWPKGADFLTILAEVNVARRSTRRLVASILSAYPCFSQRSGSPVWHYDAKKVEEGIDKTKKRFIKK